MPHYVIERITEALNHRGRSIHGSKILVMGAAYKPNVDDCRESPSVELMELLEERGAIVTYNDPHVPELPPLRGHTIRMSSTELSAESLSSQDCVLLATDHAAYDWPKLLPSIGLLIDTRGATRKIRGEFSDRIVTA